MALSLITFVAGTKIKSSEVNSNFSAINAELYDIDENNLAAGTQIPDSKLAQIVSTDAVDGAAISTETIDAVKGQFIWYLAGAISTGTDYSAAYVVSCNLTIVQGYLYCKTAPTGDDLIVDINKNGTSVFSTPPQINDGATSGSATSSTALASGDVLTVDIDQVGSTIAGADLTIHLRVEQKVPQ